MPPSPTGPPRSYSPGDDVDDTAPLNYGTDDDEPPGLAESDDEDFKEPPNKRHRATWLDEDEDAVADLFVDSDDEDKVINALVQNGVQPDVAKKKARDIVNPNQATFVEMYGRGGTVREANTARRDLNVKGLAAFDIRTSKPDGNPWDFNKRSDRQLAMNMLDELDPYFVIGSPPCTAFCAWNAKMNFRKMPKDKVTAIIQEGQRHLNFMIRIYKRQLARGKYFIHEHPASAVSWDEREMVKLMAHRDVILTQADQCMYGLTTRTDGGGTAPALKPTKFLTNSEPMARLLRTRCDKSHVHQALVSGRCADAAFHPLPLVRTLIRGIRDTKAESARRSQARIEKNFNP